MPRESDDFLAPTRCPFCSQTAICATDRKVTAESYWRCEKCGQLWNPGRLRSSAELGGQYGQFGRSRR